MTDEIQSVADWFSRPGDTISSLMQRRALAARDVAEALDGGMAQLRGLLEGTIAIDAKIARSLAKKLGGTAEFWLRRQKNYDTALSRALHKAVHLDAEEWLDRVPGPATRPGSSLSEAKREDALRRRLVFFNVASLKTWEARYGGIKSETRFRTSPSFSSGDAAVITWLRRGELEADLIRTRPWSPSILRERLEAIGALTKISHPARFLPKLRQICADAGVAVVVVRSPQGCHASGATRLVTPDKAMILLSFRHRSDDQFWFTFFHEMGHLLLHDARTFVDEDETPDEGAEKEANEFAVDCIVPVSRRPEFLQLTGDRDSVVRFAVSVGVCPGLIVGQMQHEGMIDYNRLNGLKRRWTWAEIEPALASL